MYNNNKDLPITYENQRLMQIFRDYASDIIFSIENIDCQFINHCIKRRGIINRNHVIECREKNFKSFIKLFSHWRYTPMNNMNQYFEKR